MTTGDDSKMRDKIDCKIILKAIWIIGAILGVFLVLFLVDKLVCQDMDKVSDRIYLKDNWKVTINGEVYENVSIDKFSFQTVNKDDVIVLETVVPQDIKYIEAVLCIRTCHAAVSMYIDDELEYEYGMDRYKDNKSTGSGYLFANFYHEYEGKNLKLVYVVVEDNAFSSIGEIYMTEWSSMYRNLATTNRLPLLVGSFLLVFGAMMSLVQIFAATLSKQYRNAFLLALFSICVGIWTLCYYDVMFLFAIPLYSISLIEHMSLFIGPLPLMGYMYSYVEELNSKIMKYIHNGVCMVQFILTFTALILHRLNIVHFAEMLKYFQALIIIQVCFLLYVIYIGNKRRVVSSKVTTIGMVMMLVCIFYEMIAYLVSRYMGFEILQIKGMISVGLTIFIGILVIDLYQRVTKNMMEEQEKALLIKRAYTDELTQLHNRTYCSEFMREISLVKHSKYTIINFDLNGLKQMNDTYGHTKGDELICYAALVLDQTFSGEGVVGRMGGDEFIAIIESDDVRFIEQLIDIFKENIKNVNKKKPDLGLSISYGYAISTEFEGESFEKVYNIADERMYACKQKMKQAKV